MYTVKVRALLLHARFRSTINTFGLRQRFVPSLRSSLDTHGVDICRKHCSEMTKKKAVIFDIGGVIITPPQSGIMKYGKSLGLPSNFLEGVMVMGGDDNAFRRMERGELTRTEFCSEYKKEVEKAAKEMNINLLSTFDPDILYENMGASCTVVLPMINAILALRKHGYTICILTNNSIDDTTALNNNSNRSFYSLLHLLRHISHHVIESCRVGIRKPSPDIYQLACDTMGIQPSEAVFLDDIGSNLKSAKKMGIQTIKVVDTTKALQDLKDATGINVFEEQFPPAVSPDKIVHSYVTTKAGHRIHYVDMGEGPVVLCVHGFPECWFAWRYQILPLVLAGYRVIVPDMLGYGDSSSPPEIEKYTQQQLCESIISLLDALCISSATFLGHDWGGSVVWNLGLFYPDRTRAIGGINTPMYPVKTDLNPLVALKKSTGVYSYQLYFQKPGVAEAELGRNIERSLKFFLSSNEDKIRMGVNSGKIGEFVTSNVMEKGGILVDFPDNPPCPQSMTRQDLDYYVEQFKKSGFRGPLNWYRSVEENWKWRCSVPHRKILAPALMVTASFDMVLTPKSSQLMEPWVPNLTRANLDCGHWTMVEKPKELNEILVKWLNKVHKSQPRVMSLL